MYKSYSIDVVSICRGYSVQLVILLNYFAIRMFNMKDPEISLSRREKIFDVFCEKATDVW